MYQQVVFGQEVLFLNIVSSKIPVAFDSKPTRNTAKPSARSELPREVNLIPNEAGPKEEQRNVGWAVITLTTTSENYQTVKDIVRRRKK